jgi:excisionase family DNA binding protein
MEFRMAAPKTRKRSECPTPASKSRLPVLFSVRELAERFGVSTKTVFRWIASGELPAHRLGRQLRIAEEDAIAFMATRRR